MLPSYDTNIDFDQDCTSDLAIDHTHINDEIPSQLDTIGKHLNAIDNGAAFDSKSTAKTCL